ncbi:MAG: DNA-binding protein [Candidatus Pacebacteria bacterium CG_4_10_14_3_um_filter_34_15]|nr:ORF6N domain-containing protein [Candidatus Pacearchaeota archaeon]NCQ65305.1 ORF6N domain-containing protein [Candidatus Paceibacterota bacterium]OIO44975.1 MAG: DNA-binding protein [Candidatus Pacebacteria bacterium CG1_02_43_31]PIX81899.1 MAG: DNA-binding protein [Candidatus Pacebacteria bacterium CG_4_10_14_3_um_filter_34_15]PJC44114.1 MAG: DNA-binding protein [Candidatus Pacebacteria bacterium CG_4_9_14_0_2_um_filter_34_50]
MKSSNGPGLVVNNIQHRIYTIRGVQVIIDRDLAEIYNVETRRLNEQVRRNITRFPSEFMFQLTKEEMEDWMSQIAISNKEKMGIRKTPFAFTEQGVAMLSSVLHSKTAIQVSIQIMNVFIKMRNFISTNASIFQRLDTVEKRQYFTNTKLDKVFELIESREIKPKKGIFFDGQVFDAYVFISNLVKQAKNSVVLVDNYIDESILTLFSKRAKNCTVTIYTNSLSRQLKLDLEKHNAQYPPIEIKVFRNSHDHFLILDNKEVFHIGASLKDLGKKWFAFSKFNKNALKILDKLKD